MPENNIQPFDSFKLTKIFNYDLLLVPDYLKITYYPIIRKFCLFPAQESSVVINDITTVTNIISWIPMTI